MNLGNTVIVPPLSLAGSPSRLLSSLSTLGIRWSPEVEGGGDPAHPLRILMVEDDVALAGMYAMRLRRDGHQVTTVHDGETGLAEALDGDYDLVFLDISLPRMDGMTVLQRMRESAKATERPVVILSNYSEPPLIARGAELGARLYLVKSETSPTQVAASLRGWLSN